MNHDSSYLPYWLHPLLIWVARARSALQVRQAPRDRQELDLPDRRENEDRREITDRLAQKDHRDRLDRRDRRDRLDRRERGNRRLSIRIL